MNGYRLILNKIVEDPRYQANVEFGKPRRGHPEGSIRAHIEELERNLERTGIAADSEQYWQLKVLIHVHDTFKGEAKPGASIAAPNSHASLAASYLRESCNGEIGGEEIDSLVAMTQWHDEPFALWRQESAKGTHCPDRLGRLFANITDWDTFVWFLWIDNFTVGKSRKPLDWFFRLIATRVPELGVTIDLTKSLDDWAARQ